MINLFINLMIKINLTFIIFLKIEKKKKFKDKNQ